MNKLASVLILFVVASSAFAAELPKELQPRYDGLLKSTRALNSKAFHGFFADNFVNVDAAGKETKRGAFFQMVDGMFASAKSATTAFKCSKSTKTGDTIAVSFDFKLTLQQKAGGSAVAHEVGVDTWKKVGGKWLIVKTVDTAFDVTEKKAAGGKQKKR